MCVLLLERRPVSTRWQSAKAFVGSSSCTPGLQFSRETRQLPARSVLQAHERRMCPRGRGARGLAVQQGDTNADTADGDSDALFASLRARQKQLEQERSRRKLVDFSVEAVVRTLNLNPLPSQNVANRQDVSARVRQRGRRECMRLPLGELVARSQRCGHGRPLHRLHHVRALPRLP